MNLHSVFSSSTMNNIHGKESLYFKMNSDKTETDARIYYNIVGESAAPEVEHTNFRLMCSQAAAEKRQASAVLENPLQSDAVIVRRMLFFMSAVAVVALVASTAALLLAAMKSRSDSPAKVQDFGGSRMIDSQDYDRTVKIAANMTALVQKMEGRMQKVEQSKILERIMKNLTTGLSSTQQELDVLSQNLTYSKASQMSGLRNIWKSLNDSVEKTADLINKLIPNTYQVYERGTLIYGPCFYHPRCKDMDRKGGCVINSMQREYNIHVNNISRMAGPVGPRGFNGSQGDAGLKGPMGPPGSNGAGNFSSCRYKVEEGDFTPGNPNTLASKTEPGGKRILGATCSTNFAAEYNLLWQQQSSGKWRYVCTCKGTSTLFTPQKGETKHCYLHFWECPLTT